MPVSNSFVDTIAITYTGNGKAVNSKTGTYTGAKDAGIAAVVLAGAVNQEIDIVFPVAGIQAMVIASDQDVTVKVNSTTTPTPTLSIKKTAGVSWGTDFAGANPLTTDVAKMYVSNPGVTDAKFDVRVLYN